MRIGMGRQALFAANSGLLARKATPRTARFRAVTDRMQLVDDLWPMFALDYCHRAFGVAAVQPNVHAAIGPVRLGLGFKACLRKQRCTHRLKAAPFNGDKYVRVSGGVYLLTRPCEV